MSDLDLRTKEEFIINAVCEILKVRLLDENEDEYDCADYLTEWDKKLRTLLSRQPGGFYLISYHKLISQIEQAISIFKFRGE